MIGYSSGSFNSQQLQSFTHLDKAQVGRKGLAKESTVSEREGLKEEV